MLSDSGRIKEEDKKFEANIEQANYSNRLFTRLVAKRREFKHVDFKYSVFDSAYIRGCSFDSCDFTGCRFIGSNLYGSSFTGCKFEYATFERTLVDTDILDASCPGYENLKMRFARSLRMNYQQIGDCQGVNKAICIELEANEVYLNKAWRSNESYYRKKYAGFRRFKSFLEWCQFKLMDHIWGNGERPLRLIRTTLFALIVIALYDVSVSPGGSQNFNSYYDALSIAPQVLLGVTTPEHYNGHFLVLVILTRLLAFALFTSMMIKRINRR